MVSKESERLAVVLQSAPYDGQTEHLKQHLDDFSRNHGQPAEKIINYRLQRYNGRTPVHLAAFNGLWECLEILLKNGGDPNYTSSATDLCQTPLHLAALKGYAKCLQSLLDHHAVMEIENIHRVTALDLVRGKRKCERVFQHAIARVQIPSRTREQQQRVERLHHLVEDGENLGQFKDLFDSLPADHMDLSTRWTDFYQNTLLFRACSVECLDVVRYLLARSSCPPLHNLTTEETPLMVVVKRSNYDIARLLLAHTPLLLFKQDAQKKLSPLHIACSRGDSEMVRLMLECLRRMIADKQYHERNPLSLDLRDCLGRTPLFNACYYGFAEIVHQLVEFQAAFPRVVRQNINAAVSDTNRTPLHAAVRKGKVAIIRILLAAKNIDINAEAKPSTKTHRRVMQLLHRRLHGRMLPQPSTPIPINEEDKHEFSFPPGAAFDPNIYSSSTPASICSTPSLHSPSTGSTGGIDEGLGHLRPSSPDEASPALRNSNTEIKNSGSLHYKAKFNTELHHPPSATKSLPAATKVRAATDTDVLAAFSDGTIGVFEGRGGKLEVLPLNQSQGLRKFDSLFLTPLAEACAYGHSDIADLLLGQGAQDDTGLACRIASLVLKPDLVRTILAHHCTFVDRKGEIRHTSEPRRSQGLQLHWDSKKLPSLHSSWFTEDSLFFPPNEPEDEDNGTFISLKPGPRHLSRRFSFLEVSMAIIRIVHLEQNCLEGVPLELFLLPNTLVIDLSRNQLTSLPEREGTSDVAFGGWECAQLEELNLNYNRLKRLPACVWILPSLRKLFVSHNKVESLLPAGGQQVREELLSCRLESIDFSYNELRVLPRFTFELCALTKAVLHHNQLESLPDTVWSCAALHELILSDNQLASLPWCEPESSMIPSRTEVGTGPPILLQQSDRGMGGILEVRVKFDSQGADMGSRQTSVTGGILPLEVAGKNFVEPTAESCDYSSLIKLNLAHNKLTSFPEALPCLAPNLVDLDISDNTFQSIDIQFLPLSLKKLTAKKCKIERFGNTIMRDMYAQVVHHCRYGKTFGLPCQHRSHTRLQNVTTLQLSNNSLRHFQLLHHRPLEAEDEDPTEAERKFRTISNLELLYPSLEGLDLVANCLQGEFNPNIGHQTHLKWIWLRKNQELEKVPREFAYLKNTRQFTELAIEDLPNLIEPPREYQSVSLTHLLTYMRSRLKESVSYRTIKLFFIGRGERGKTTLLRRLRGLPDEKTLRTQGIDIENWDFPEQKRFALAKPRNPVHFLAWDFAGQDVYHTTHQCFYSRRALYLALFRLSDDVDGVRELDPWLRNLQLRAPGSPVIIVGTCLDLVSEQRAKELERIAMETYSDTKIYPKVIKVECVSCVRKALGFFSSNIDKLRNFIYDVACHLQLQIDGQTLEYKPEMPEGDPKALFQQQIPKSFLDLQVDIRKTIAEYRKQNRTPILNEDEFRIAFKDFFEDDDELNEAVYFLNLQGTLLHFEDHGLKNVYFLDPQWLAKLMADVISPSSARAGIRNGIGDITLLFSRFDDIPVTLKEKYIQLLEKFEVALKINRRHVIIPSLMDEKTPYPPTNDVLSDCSWLETVNLDTFYQPTLRRFWLSPYIPDGFWPRLICRIANDHQIGKLLRMLIGDDLLQGEDERFPLEEGFHDKEVLNWLPWKTGIAFAHRGITLFVVKQQNNISEDHLITGTPVHPLPGRFRVETHVYTPEWVKLAEQLLACDRCSYTVDCLPALATRLLVLSVKHITSLAMDWFPGMLTSTLPARLTTYAPCWKCFAELEVDKINDVAALSGTCIFKNVQPVHCFNMDDCILPAVQQRDLACAIHRNIRVAHMAPDLLFRDIQPSTGYEDTHSHLEVTLDEVLGKGGYGFVCEGKIISEHGRNRSVAVKVFLHEIDGLVDRSTISELLELSKQPRHLLYAYREIRQEVAFLSALEHPNLTQLDSVRIHPYMCLLLELAPQKSLRNLLKEYRECSVVLEPLTLKATTMQISSGLEYLHRNQIVHLDMKSPNVLIWYFPSPEDSRQQRIRQAGNVLLKIADYGISQVSQGLTLRVGNNPVGTPGFMAPELFENPGQEVSSEKVDVFAFGMTLYELLSLRSPFDLIVPHVKRNHEVREKQRPTLRARETRSLVILQDLMTTCWSHEPEERPKMRQIKECASSAEFDRLRAEISLKGVKSISCACVCRITPENETSRARPTPTHVLGVELDTVFRSVFDDVPSMDGSLDIFPSNSVSEYDTILPSNSEDSVPVERAGGEVVGKEEEDVYHFLPHGLSAQSPLSESGDSQHTIEPYTQMWLCGRDTRKGLLQIFTYYDGQAGCYSFSGYCSKDEVTAICPVRNNMWLATSSGTLKIFHAPTLKVKFSGKVKLGDEEASACLDILHVDEYGCVLVATLNGDIWSFKDRVVHGGLKVEEKISLPASNPCYHMTIVKVQGSVEVWGTMDNNRVLLLSRARDGWEMQEFVSDPGDLRLRLCSFITHCSFIGRDGIQQNHIWISYRHRSMLVSWDAQSRRQRALFNCADKLKTSDNQAFQVSALVANERQLFIGTTAGTVGVFDSETLQLLATYHWHKGKCRTLLAMPRQMESCICAEIPFQEKSEGTHAQEFGSTAATDISQRLQTSTLSPRRPVTAVENLSTGKPSDAFSFMKNQMFIPNRNPDSVLITSIGGGRKRMVVNETSKAKKIKMLDDALQSSLEEGRPITTSSHKASEDVCLLTWRS